MHDIFIKVSDEDISPPRDADHSEITGSKTSPDYCHRLFDPTRGADPVIARREAIPVWHGEQVLYPLSHSTP